MKKRILSLLLLLAIISNSILVSATSYYQVVGDSMNPVLKEGDTIQIISETYEDGDMVVAQLQDGRKIVKRLMGDRLISVGQGTSYPVSDVTILGAAEYVPMSLEELDLYGFSWNSVLAEGVTITQIAAGNQHALALTSEGVVYAWGLGDSGQLGDGVGGPGVVHRRSTPIKVLDGEIVGGNRGVTAISTYEDHSLVLKNGVVYSWGIGEYGKLGDGETTNRSTPVRVSSAGDMPNTSVSAISAGSSHSLALENGVVYAWGNGSYGQLGDGIDSSVVSNHKQTKPVRVASDGAMTNTSVSAISAGGYHSLALENGVVYAWGYAINGQLGNGKEIFYESKPFLVKDGAMGNSEVTAISAGSIHSLALKGGVVYAWGYNQNGAVGNGVSAGTTNPNTPVKVVDNVGTFTNSEVTAISAGSHSLALKNGKVYAWGHGSYGELGNGRTATLNEYGQIIGSEYYVTRPVEVSAGAMTNNSVTAISAGSAISLALKDGKMYAWGRNNAGQLGNGTNVVSSTPVQTTHNWLYSSDAGLTSVAAQTDNYPAGENGDTKATPITWSVNVANDKASVGRADIIAATNATMNLYSNNTFTTELTGENTIALTEGASTIIYVKVTAQDNTTIKYYAITINRAANPADINAVTAAKTAIVNGAVAVAFGADQTAKTAAV